MPHRKYFFKYLKVLIVVLTIFVAVKALEALKEYSYIGLGTPATNTITVSGKGEILAEPNIADFTFTVSEDGTTAEEAQNKATTKNNAALDAVKAAGVADTDIKTLSYDLSPKYQYSGTACPLVVPNQTNGTYIPPCPPGKQVIVGYTVTQSVEVKVRQIDNASPLLTKIAAIGVSYISGISFVVDNQDALQEQAREKAIADAKDKATVLAKSLGVHLSRIVNFSDNQGPIYYANAYGTDSAQATPASAPTPELPPGQNTITSNVSITYEIN